MNELELWIARDEDGEITLSYGSLVILKGQKGKFFVPRDGNEMTLELPSSSFPELTFENSPKRVKLTIMED